jgi:putative spermidine/putrescine transport system substrate-binding protein
MNERGFLSRRQTLLLPSALAGVLGGAGRAAFAQAKELVVTLPGGTLERILRKSWVEPFQAKTGAKAIVVTGLTMENLAKLRAQKGNPQIDIVIFDPPGAVPAANEGLLEKLDPARIPNLKDQIPWEIQKHGLFATMWVSNQVLAYNTQSVKEAPKSWADLWKPEYKGKVLLPDIGTSHGLFFISMISKMESGDMYNTDAAFARLKTLKPNVLTFWTSHDQVAQLLNSGEGWLAPWTSDRALAQTAAGAPIALTVPKEGAVYFTSHIGIAKGTKHKELAEAFLNIAISPEAQLIDAQEAFVAPSNSKVKLTGQLAENLAYGDRLKSLLAPDWAKLDEMRGPWTERWNREIR